MRLIDANALWKEFDKAGIFDNENPRDVAQRLVEEAPDAIVRCKDCVHRPRRMWESSDGFGLEFPDYVCPCYCDDGYYSWMPKDDFFCASGERRTNE